MGFNGGGGGQLLNHRHDGSIPLDGGPLSFLNITQSGMSAGSVTQSDGVHLQELAIGTPNQVPRVNAGATALEYHTPADVGEELVNKGSLHGCTGGSVQTELAVSATDGDYLQADSTAAAGLSYASPVVHLLATYTAAGGDSAETVVVSPAVNLVDDYTEIWVIANMYTNSAAGFGECTLKLNGLVASYTPTYGYSFDGSTFTNIQHAGTTYHLLATAALTSTNSAVHTVTKISLAKTSTTTNTVYFKTDSIGDQGISEHFESTLDLGAETLNAVKYTVSLANWAAGSNFQVFGVKQ